jgi:hypothetical protein
MYKAGAAQYFDILSANAFGMDLPPDSSPSPGKLNFSRVVLQREIMERYGDVDKAVWFNEYGWNAAPATFPDDELVWKRVSEEEQAAYTLQGIEYARVNWPWAGVFNIWYFRQVGNIPPDSASYYFRMVDVDFIPRRIYFAIKDKSAQLKEAGAGFFQETNPSVSASREQWQTRIEPQASGESTLQAETPGSNLTFTFSGQNVELVAWASPDGGQLLATLDGENLSGLPLDNRGRSYLDLYAPNSVQVSLPVVQDASQRRHTLRLTVSELANPDSSGSQCVIDAFQVTNSSTRPFPTFPVIALISGCIAVGTLLGRATMANQRSE